MIFIFRCENMVMVDDICILKDKIKCNLPFPDTIFDNRAANS